MYGSDGMWLRNKVDAMIGVGVRIPEQEAKDGDDTDGRRDGWDRRGSALRRGSLLFGQET